MSAVTDTAGALAAFIISSDPQYPRTPENGDAEEPRGALNKNGALAMLQANYRNMQNYRDTHPNRIVPVLVNGDITEFGDKGDGDGETQLSIMTEYVFPLLGDKEEDKELLLIGLGNHDYDNNVNDTADNGAAGGMLEWFPGAKPTTAEGDFDWRENFYDGWTGDIWYLFSSYAYAVEKNDPAVPGATYRFIQLNNFPEYARHFETGSAIGDEHIYNVTTSTKWLAAQLKIAGDKQQIVIVSMHQNLMGPAVRSLLEDANVTLVCVGHTHQISTKIEGTPALPIVNSGASFKGDYLIAEAEGGTLNIYAVKNNDHSQKSPIGSVPLKIANSTISQDDIGRYVTFEKDYEDYTEGVGAYVTLAKQGVYYMQPDDYFNDSVDSCTINRADAGTVFTVYDHPGDKDTEGGDFDPHDDDYAVITIKKTLVQPIEVSTFEEDFENEFISVKAHYENGLDGKISRVAVKRE